MTKRSLPHETDAAERSSAREAFIRAERLAAIGTLAAGVAHEFNNINATILGFTDLALERRDLDPSLRDWLGRIKKSALRSNAIAQNLLAFCAPPTPPRSMGDLNLLVREVMMLAAPRIEELGVEACLDLGAVPEAPLDPSGIVQLLLQMITNAADAMHGRPVRRLTIATGRQGQNLFVRVSDTGCGILPEDLPRIFTPFYSTKGAHAGSLAREGISGTGLGLSVCHAIVESHGGRIEVESAPGDGTAFTILLPASGPA